ncbi:MAG: toxin HicA [Fibrobacter sp.]|nr:toxin HicA [Fibrobacter sp.]
MSGIDKLLIQMIRNPKGVKFADLSRVCEHFFGQPRQSGSSHAVYKTPWIGDPRVNIQNEKGMAKAYQVKQVLKAIERLRYESTSE